MHAYIWILLGNAVFCHPTKFAPWVWSWREMGSTHLLHTACVTCSCSQVLCSRVEDLIYFFMMAALNWTPGQWLRISPRRTVHVSLPFMDAKMPWLKLCTLLLKITTSRDQLLYHLMQMFIKCRCKTFLPCNEVLLHLHDNTGYAIFVMRPKMSSYHCLSLGRAGLRQ